MADNTPGGPATEQDGPPSADPIPQAYALVHALGIIVKNTMTRCWLSERDAEQVREAAYELLTRSFASTDEIAFNVLPGNLTINANPLPRESQETVYLVEHLNALEIKRFSLAREITYDDFGKLMAIISRPYDQVQGEDGFAEAIRGEGIDHVRVRKVYYREVAEDQVVVDREATQEEEKGQGMAAVMAFLKGDLPAEERARVIEAVRSPDTDSAELAAAIMAVAEPQAAAAGQSVDNELGDLVVDCVRRAFDALMKDPAAKTQKGKKTVSRRLVDLETALLDMLRKAEAAREDGAEETISEAIRQMQEEVRIDAIAAEYLRKRSAAGKSEDRILRFVKSRGLDALRATDLPDRLKDGGLTSEDWVELLVRGGLLDPTGEASGAVTREQFEGLLAGLEKGIAEAGRTAADGDRESLTNVVREVDRTVNALVADTHQRIRDLANEVHEDEAAEPPAAKPAAKPGTPRKTSMTRKRMLVILAELVQEMCQPLSVITCSLDMISTQTLGDVNDSQVDVLRLASDSAAKVKTLVNDLRKISGDPDSLTPDADIQASFYA